MPRTVAGCCRYSPRMRRLNGAHELLDGPLDEQVLAGNLRDLARVNRWLGGAELSRRALAAVPGIGGRPVLSVLDVGTGAADVPMALAASIREAGLRPHVVAVD